MGDPKISRVHLAKRSLFFSSEPPDGRAAVRSPARDAMADDAPPPAVTLADERGAAGQALKALLSAVPPKDDDGELFHGGGALS